MTNEQINIAIAEACGWYEEDNESEICWTRDELTYCLHEDELPNYCNDLNAMHEAEKVLTNEQWVAYGKELSRLGVFPMVHANAKERTEAFLRTFGKWEE
jgi:hypothetical protein